MFLVIKRIYVYLRHETTTTGRFPGNINSKDNESENNNLRF